MGLDATDPPDYFLVNCAHPEHMAAAIGDGGAWTGRLRALRANASRRSQAEMESQYNVLSQNITGDVCELTLQPKSATARKMMPQIKIGFSTKDWSLRLNEMQFADGSIMRCRRRCRTRSRSGQPLPWRSA